MINYRENPEGEIIFEGRVPGIFVEETRRGKDYSMLTRHFHKSIELYFLCSGERFYFVDQDTFHLKAHMGILIHQNQIHKTSAANAEPHHRFLLQLEPERFGEYFHAFGLPRGSEFGEQYCGAASFDEDTWHQIVHALEGMRTEFRRPHAFSEQLITMYAFQLLLIFSKHRLRLSEPAGLTPAPLQQNPATVNTGMYQKVHELALYLQNHSHEHLELAQLARQFYLSKAYMSRIFKSVTGFTIIEYQTFVRIQKAQLLLAKTTLSITDIASQTGFGNVTYFERVFKKTTASTPLRFRQNQSCSSTSSSD